MPDQDERPAQGSSVRDRQIFVALIGAAGTVIGALIGFFGGPVVVNSPTASIPTVVVTETVTTPAVLPASSPGAGIPASGSPSPSSDSSPENGDWIPTYTGDVTIGYKWVDLDAVPPVAASLTGDIRTTGASGVAYLTSWSPGVFGVVPDEDPDPGADGCNTLATAAGSGGERLTVAAGTRLCLQTNAARAVLVEITEVSLRGVENSDIQAKVTVWTGPRTH